MLTTEQVERYHREGYVTPDYRLPYIVLDDIRAAHDRLIDRHPEYRDYMPTTSVYCHDESTRFQREGILDMSQRTIYLMRGVDRSGQNDFRMRY